VKRSKRGLQRRYGRSGAGGVEKSTRYSGNLKITMKLAPDSRSYKVTVRSLDRDSHPYHVTVGTPAHLTGAVDSIRAYDNTARAALSFAADDGWPVDDEAVPKRDGSGYFVTGKKSHRFGYLGRKA
jgi:hypothetical protein